MNSKRIYIRTFGCQMNIRDSEYVMGLLLDHGYIKADSLEGADVILFNSCSIRKHAEERLISNIADLKKLKRKRPSLVIGLMGCTAQSYKEEILKRAPLIDFSCGPGNEGDLPQIIADVILNHQPVIAVDKVHLKRPEVFSDYRESSLKSFVSIGEGCNNFCSYCIVPYVRGRERSRAVKDIVREVEELSGRGCKEITLLGQNVNSFADGSRRGAFVRLLERLDKVNGIERIRFMTSHPKDASPDLFRAMRDLSTVCEHLHLPLQSGSDKILKLMNRGYTRKRYLELAEEYNRILPGGSLTTDIIVGFPSESASAFAQTMQIVKRVRFDGAFTFKYSPRPPALAAKSKDDVPQKVKEERLAALMELQYKIGREKNLALVGTKVDVFVDEMRGKESRVTGKTRTNKTIHFEGGNALIGKIVDVIVESGRTHSLIGRIAR